MTSVDAPAAAVRRAGPVGALLGELVEAVVQARGRAAVLDCGGGSGIYAVALALAGADVTVVDVSADALSTLGVRAREAGVSSRVTAVQAEVEDPGALATRAFDLVLAHGILDAVDDPKRAFAAIAEAVATDGRLSVLAGNPAAVVLARVLAGELPAALHELDVIDSGGLGTPLPDLIPRWCSEAGLTMEHRAGVDVLRDLVPGVALDAPGAGALLDELERRCAQREPFVGIAGHVHVVARRSGSGRALDQRGHDLFDEDQRDAVQRDAVQRDLDECAAHRRPAGS